MTLGYLIENKVVAIIRGATKDNVVKVVETLSSNGIKCIEITVEEDGAIEAINVLNALNIDACIGAGTVLTLEDAKKVIEANAKFIFAPILNKEVVSYANSKNIPIIPGALTPNEIYEAINAGADAVKIFPIEAMGTNYLKSLKAPLPKIPMFVTGGVSVDNAKTYLNNGADGIGMGSWLVDLKKVSNSDFYEVLEEKCKLLLDVIK